jgi:hypothetical protein
MCVDVVTVRPVLFGILYAQSRNGKAYRYTINLLSTVQYLLCIQVSVLILILIF